LSEGQLNNGKKDKGIMFRETRVAIDAVVKACGLCVKNRCQSISKLDKSPVTVCDFGVQALVNSIINLNFPNDSIIAEESSKDLKELAPSVHELLNSVMPMTMSEMLASIDLGSTNGSSRFWCLDPVDGTKGFLRGDQYAICLALIVNGSVELGVIGCPNLPHNLANPDSRGSVFYAIRGAGAFERRLGTNVDIPIHVSSTQVLSDAIFCESFESAHSAQSVTASISKMLNISKPPIRMDSQCKYALVARGDADIYLRIPKNPDYVEKIWDHAPGSLLISEAGGTVTDMNGNPLDFSTGRTLKNNNGIVATTNSIHSLVLSATQQT
jgi:3'(2'), 5'-bisphosphate nucleotidase